MVIAERTANAAACLAAALLVVSLNGCFVFGKQHQLTEPLPLGSIAEIIRPGVTTKQDLLERFGPPVAIARQGTTMVYPPPRPGKMGGIEVDASAFFALFSGGREPGKRDIVYYYESSRVTGLGVVVFPIIGGGYISTRVAVKRLWVLLDDGTGIVKEYTVQGER